MLQKTKMTFLRLFAIIGFVVLFAIASISLASCSSDDSASTTLQINSNGELVVTYSDGSTENLGTVVGADGATGATGSTGATGNGISKMEYDEENNTVVITYTDGSTTTLPWVASSSTSSSDDCDHILDSGESAYVTIMATVSESTVKCGQTYSNLIYCSKCGNVSVEFLTKQHKYSDTATTVAATCEEAGYDYYPCQNEGCTGYKTNDDGTMYQENVKAALGHTWDSGVVTEATCTEGGYTTYTCTREGCTYGEDNEAATKVENEVAAKGHDYDLNTLVQYIWNDTDTTCNGGGIAVYQCKNCHDMVNVKMEAGMHTYDVEAGTTTINKPDASKDGSISGYCTICKQNTSDTLKALTSTSGDSMQATETGETYSIVRGSVTDCDDGRVDTYTLNYQDYTGKELTFTAEVTLSHQIAVSASKTYTVSSTDKNSTDTTLTTSGQLNYVAISSLIGTDSDSVLVAQTTSGRTCDTAYEYEYECAVCGQTESIYIKEAHNYVYAVKQATTNNIAKDETTGVYSYTGTGSYETDDNGNYLAYKFCTICGDGKDNAASKDNVYKTATGSSSTDADATCDTTGYKTVIVTFADKTSTQTLTKIVTPSLGHVWNEQRIPDGAVIHLSSDGTLAYYTTLDDDGKAVMDTTTDKVIITIIYGTYSGSDYTVSGSSTVTLKSTALSITKDSGSTACATGSTGTTTFFCEVCGDYCAYDATTDHDLSVAVTEDLTTSDSIYYNGTLTSVDNLTEVLTANDGGTGYLTSVAATCGDAGYKIMQCSVCGEVHYVTVAALGHSYAYAVKSSEDDETKLGADGYEYVAAEAYTYNSAASSYTIVRYCTVCGAIDSENTYEGKSISKDTANSTEADCANEGKSVYILTYTVEVDETIDFTVDEPMTGHYLSIGGKLVEIDSSLVYYIGTNSYGAYAYYIDEGSKHVYLYGTDGTVENPVLVAADATSYYQMRAAGGSVAACGDSSVSSYGYFLCSCANHTASADKSVVVNIKTAHTYVADTNQPDVDATAVTEGKIYWKCESCSETYTQILDPLGFEYSASKVKYDATSSAIVVTLVDDSKNEVTLTIYVSGGSTPTIILGEAYSSADVKVTASKTYYTAGTVITGNCSTADVTPYTYCYEYIITIGDNTYTFSKTGLTLNVPGNEPTGSHSYYTVNGTTKVFRYDKYDEDDMLTYTYSYYYCTTCGQYIATETNSKVAVTLTEGKALSGTIGDSELSSIYAVTYTVAENGVYTLTLSGTDADKVMVYGYDGSYDSFVYINFRGYNDTTAYFYSFDYEDDVIVKLAKGTKLTIYVALLDSETASATFTLLLELDEDFDYDTYFSELMTATCDYVLTTSGLAFDLAYSGSYWYPNSVTVYVSEAGTYTISVDATGDITVESGNDSTSVYNGNSESFTLAAGDVLTISSYADSTITITAAGGTTPSTPTVTYTTYTATYTANSAYTDGDTEERWTVTYGATGADADSNVTVTNTTTSAVKTNEKSDANGDVTLTYYYEIKGASNSEGYKGLAITVGADAKDVTLTIYVSHTSSSATRTVLIATTTTATSASDSSVVGSLTIANGTDSTASYKNLTAVTVTLTAGNTYYIYTDSSSNTCHLYEAILTYTVAD